jgi:hypothetical protein
MALSVSRNTPAVFWSFYRSARLRQVRFDLKFCLGHLEEGLRGGSSQENPAASTKVKAVSIDILA